MVLCRVGAVSEGDGMCPRDRRPGKLSAAKGSLSARRLGGTGLDFCARSAPAAFVTTPVPKGFAPP